MAKNAFALFGIIAVLLLSLGIVSAANGFNLNVVTGLPATVTPGQEYSVTVNFNNTNITYDSVVVSFERADSNIWTEIPENQTVDKNTNADFTAKITIPLDATGSHGKQLRAYYYDGSEELSYVSASFIINSTVPDPVTEIVGCMTPTNDGNYSADATVHDASLCTGVPTPPTDAQTLCEKEGFDEDGDLKITDFDINIEGEGKDDEWQYLDKVEIIIEVENTHNSEDIKDVEVRIVIMDGKIENGGNDVTNDFDLDDDILTSIGTLRDGRSKREDVTFTIDELSPEDIDSGTYYIYVMAYEENNEAEQCESMSDKISNDDYYFEFDIESVDDDEAVVARGIGIDAPVDTYCGQQNLQISIPIYNLGDNDEERVLVILSDFGMGIYESRVIRNLDSGDREDVNFFVDIPLELSKDRDNLDVTVYFDWDEDEDDENPANYDDDTSDESVRLNILSCRGPEPTVNPNLDSASEVGTNLIVKTIVTNNGEDNNFQFTVSDFESWAELVSITPQTSSINEGEFIEVTIIFNPKEAGQQSFKINTIVDGESYEQSVSVNIAKNPGFFSSMSDTLTYIIIAIIAILVLIFLVLIAKISRRPAKPQF